MRPRGQTGHTARTLHQRMAPWLNGPTVKPVSRNDSAVVVDSFCGASQASARQQLCKTHSKPAPFYAAARSHGRTITPL